MKKNLFIFIVLILLILPWEALGASNPGVVSGSVNPVRLAQESDSENEDEDQYQYDNPVPAQTAPIVNVNQDTNSAPAINSSTNTNTSIPTLAAQPTPTQTAFPWAWVINRSAGIASYILLALITITGILLTTGLLFRLFEPSVAWSIHRAVGSALLVSVVIHVFSLLFDHFIRLRILDLLVPFVSPYRPLLVALGVTGFYILLLQLATSLYTMTKYPKFWRTIHFFAFPMFVLIFLHGTLIGTDRHQSWVVAMYWVTAIMVAVFVIYRLFWKFQKTALVKS